MEYVYQVFFKRADKLEVKKKGSLKKGGINMSMEFSNGNYTFISQYGKVADVQTRKQMDKDGDGKISEEEKNLFYEDYYRTRKSELTNFKSNNPEKELGFEFDMLDVNKDGFLDENEQKMMDELLKMSDIANEFIQKNSQYKVGNFGGVVADVKRCFEMFTKTCLDSPTDKPLSELFRDSLNSTLSASNLSKNTVNALINSNQEAARTDLNRDINAFKADGISADESAKLEERVSNSLMSRALQNCSVEDILSNLLEGVTDANVKSQIIANANKMVELVNSRYTVAPDAFFAQLNQLADGIAKLVSGKGIVQAGTDNRSAIDVGQYTLKSNAYLPTRLSRAESNIIINSALNITPKNESCLGYIANMVVEWYKQQGRTIDTKVVMDVLQAMPTDKDYSVYIRGDGTRLNETFVNTFNETLKACAQGINGEDITLAYDENLQIKANPTEADTDPFYTQKTTEAAAKGTINALKPQIKGIAENSYLLKGLEFNQELFDKTFTSVSDAVMNQFKEGKVSTMNQVLNALVTQFNPEWFRVSISDIDAKVQQQQQQQQQQ